ncbi:MAG TPA: recombinase family protein [Solirubrobacteraceae bacterium]|jgi:site-specific DNA recombinase|nr:recombinase family protein [Solirubrobacteraceae bacterium]
MTNGLHLDAYIRVSKVAGRKGESFISPKVQRERIEAWAQAHQATLTWHEPELDASGGTMSRPIFEDVMQRIRTSQTDGVIVAKLDRFARTLVGALGTLEEFDGHGAVLVSVAENLDLSTPMGKAFLRILLVFAELERDRISESWRTATSNAIDRGVHIAKYTNFGYDKGSDKRLVPNDKAPPVREVFLMRGAHRTRTEIARRLDETAPRPDGGRWTPPMVDRIIKNRVYLGWAYRGQQVNKEAHEAIVTVAEWHAANAAPVRAAARGKKPNLLGGIVRCAGCRYVLAPGGSRFGGAGGHTVPGYKCRTLHAAGTCREPASIHAHKLEQYVEAVWRQQMAQEALTVQQDTDALQTSTGTLAAAEDELAAFAADTTARRLLGSGYHAALEQRAVAVAVAQSELQRILASAPSRGTIESYDDLPTEDRKRILGSSIDAIIVKRGHSRVPIEQRVTILWRGEGPDDLPRRGRDNGPVRPYAL